MDLFKIEKDDDWRILVSQDTICTSMLVTYAKKVRNYYLHKRFSAKPIFDNNVLQYWRRFGQERELYSFSQFAQDCVDRHYLWRARAARRLHRVYYSSIQNPQETLTEKMFIIIYEWLMSVEQFSVYLLPVFSSCAIWLSLSFTFSGLCMLYLASFSVSFYDGFYVNIPSDRLGNWVSPRRIANILRCHVVALMLKLLNQVHGLKLAFLA